AHPRQAGRRRCRGGRRHRQRGAPAARRDRADRLRELRQRGGPRRRRQRPHEQVRRRVPGEALLRRLRARRPGRDPGHRAREATFRRGARERPTPFRGKRQPDGLPGAPRPGRSDPRPQPSGGRPPHAWPRRQLLRQAFRAPLLRRRSRLRPPRLRRDRRQSARGPTPRRHRRRQRLQSPDRLRPLPGDRRRRRRLPLRRCRPPRRVDRGGSPPEPDRSCPRHDDHHPQDAAGSSWGDGPLWGSAREGGRQEPVPGFAGRPVDARHRRQGRRLRRGAPAGVPGVRGGRDRERPGHGVGPERARSPDRLRRDRQPPDAGRCRLPRLERQARRSPPRRRRHHLQQKHDPGRHAAADPGERHPARHAGDDHPRLRGRGGGAGGPPDRRRPPGPRRSVPAWTSGRRGSPPDEPIPGARGTAGSDV
ncbi:MAG: Serine hydroxymethyltransferase, partial [uncultured Thermomicrobiales bacterium]